MKSESARDLEPTNQPLQHLLYVLKRGIWLIAFAVALGAGAGVSAGGGSAGGARLGGGSAAGATLAGHLRPL